METVEANAGDKKSVGGYGKFRVTLVNANASWGGGEKWFWRAACSLHDRGYGVSLWAQNELLLQRGREAGIPTLPIRVRNDLDFFAHRAALKLFNREKPDIVIVNGKREGRVIGAAAKKAGVKKRIIRMGLGEIRDSKSLRKLLSSTMTDVVCVSKALGREVDSLAWGADPCRPVVKILYNGVVMEEYPSEGATPLKEELGIEQSIPLVGTIGRLDSMKGHEFVIDALAFTHRTYADLHLVFIGEGENRDALAREAKMRGVAHAVHFVGFRNDVVDAIRSCNIIVHASISREGMPHAVLEAMALGKPVIATRVGGVPEIIESGKTGMLVDACDAGSLAQQMFLLAKDGKMRADLGDAAREHIIENFSWDETMDELEGILAEAGDASLVRDAHG